MGLVGRAAGRGAGQLLAANKGPARGGSPVWLGCGVVLPPHERSRGERGRGATACACGVSGSMSERHTHTYTHQRVSLECCQALEHAPSGSG